VSFLPKVFFGNRFTFISITFLFRVVLLVFKDLFKFIVVLIYQ
jgi:hypothetical protein